MRHYYTVDEFNTMQKAQLTNTAYKDSFSRIIIEDLIKLNMSYKSLKASDINKNIYYDLMLKHNDNTKSALEIKYRFLNHYDTMEIEDIKYLSFLRNLKANKIKNGYLFTIWNDGLIWVSNVFIDHTTELKWQNETTNAKTYTDGQKKLKLVHLYKPLDVFYLTYFYDYEDGSWSPVFNTTYKSIETLEKEYINSTLQKLF